MDLTGWPEFFTAWLATQMQETVERGQQVIKIDLLSQEHKLNDRQRKTLRHLTNHAALTIRQLEDLCPNISRRTLQRDLQAIKAIGLLIKSGETNQLNYLLANEL